MKIAALFYHFLQIFTNGNSMKIRVLHYLYPWENISLVSKEDKYESQHVFYNQIQSAYIYLVTISERRRSISPEAF